VLAHSRAALTQISPVNIHDKGPKRRRRREMRTASAERAPKSPPGKTARKVPHDRPPAASPQREEIRPPSPDANLPAGAFALLGTRTLLAKRPPRRLPAENFSFAMRGQMRMGPRLTPLSPRGPNNKTKNQCHKEKGKTPQVRVLTRRPRPGGLALGGSADLRPTLS